MSQRIEDYALVGDTHTAALVGLDGSIDWLCLPRFDSGACFAALLGDAGNGRWLLAPAGAERANRRRYRDETLILETDWETSGGAVRVTDFMPVREEAPHCVRIVEGLSGSVDDADGAGLALRLRRDRALGSPARRHAHRHRRPQRSGLADARADQRQGPVHDFAVHGRRRATASRSL